MTEKNSGGPAFPLYLDGDQENQLVFHGMTLRDWFAGQVLAGPNLGQRHPFGGSATSNTVQAIAADAYRIADAMLEARK